MQRQLKKIGVLCLLAWLAYASSAFAEGTAKRHFIMGGSADNLRAISKQDADTTFNTYLADLYKQYDADWSLQVAIYPDVPTLLAAFDKGEIDGYFGTTLDYLARKDKLCKTMVAMKYRLAELKQPLLLIVRAEDAVTKISDLRGKRLSMSDFQDIEALYLNTVLLKNKLPEIPEFFSESKGAKSTNMALMDVFFKRSDVIVMRENEFKVSIELNPQVAKKLVVLDRSVPMFATLGVMNNRISEQDFSKFLETFNKVIQTEKGKKLMGLVQVENVVKIFPDDVGGIKDLISERDRLRKLNTLATIKPNVSTRKKSDAQ